MASLLYNINIPFLEVINEKVSKNCHCTIAKKFLYYLITVGEPDNFGK